MKIKMYAKEDWEILPIGKKYNCQQTCSWPNITSSMMGGLRIKRITFIKYETHTTYFNVAFNLHHKES